MRSPDVRRARRVVAGAGAAAVLALAGASVALAAAPTASPAGGDPRSPGAGPGLVGDPLVAIVVVVAIGLGALLATMAWIRVTADRTP